MAEPEKLLSPETGGVIRAARRPVVLPGDERAEPFQRSFAIWLAALVLLGGAAGGFFYRQSWQDASSDVTRLVAASTPVYLHVPSPWKYLKKAKTFDRWRDASALDRAGRTTGLLADGINGQLAGIPLAAIRRAAIQMSDLRAAVVPTAEGEALLFFAEMKNARERRRLMLQLSPELVTVDRRLGYEIFAPKSHHSWLPWAVSEAPVRLVVIDSQMVLSIGPEEAIIDLIHARVGGRSQPIRRREDFDPLVASDPVDSWLYLDAAIAYQLVSPLIEPLFADPLALRVAFSDTVRSITARESLKEKRDELSVRLALSSRDGSGDLLRGLAPAPHHLLRGVDNSADLAVSISVRDFRKFMTLLRESISSKESRGLKLLSGPDHPMTQAINHLVSDMLHPKAFDVFSGEILLAHLAKEEVEVRTDQSEAPGQWVLGFKLRPTHDADELLARLLQQVMGPSWAYGKIFDHDDGNHLHVVRRQQRATSDSGNPLDQKAVQEFFWRVQNDLFILGATEQALTWATTWGTRARFPIDRQSLLAKMVPRIDWEAPIIAVAAPHLLANIPTAWRRILLEDLAPSFRLTASVTAETFGLHARLNVGLWTLLVMLLSHDQQRINTLFLADLPRECVEGYSILCQGRSRSAICHSFGIGQKDLLQRACTRFMSRKQQGTMPASPPLE
jgi:hypothetical protein